MISNARTILFALRLKRGYSVGTRRLTALEVGCEDRSSTCFADRGESVLFGGRAPYERIVRWTLPDTRDGYGRPILTRLTKQVREADDQPWDTLRFKNPLPVPMTTGVAMIFSEQGFSGQAMNYWANLGESTMLAITKALRVRANSVEQEERGQAKSVIIGAVTYHEKKVKGQLTIRNARRETITVLIQRDFTGELLGADESPRCLLRDEEAHFVNKRRRLVWTVRVEQGASKTLNYRYKVLVR